MSSIFISYLDFVPAYQKKAFIRPFFGYLFWFFPLYGAGVALAVATAFHENFTFSVALGSISIVNPLAVTFVT
jgi:hypothetical protein